MVTIAIALFVIGLAVWINYSTRRNQAMKSNNAGDGGTTATGNGGDNPDAGTTPEGGSEGGSDADGDGGAD